MIRIFLLNLFLAVVYMALTDDVSAANFVLGFSLGWLLLAFYTRATGHPSYTSKIFRLARFGIYFCYILIKANLAVAWEVITPGLSMSPRIVRYSVEGLTDVQITTLANAITLTPGTLSADIDPDTQLLYIHCMYGKDRDEAVRELDELKDRLLQEVFGP